MTFALHVETERWTKHVDGRLAQIAIATGHAAVPVIKGGGYGIGQMRLFEQANQRALPWIAVGTVFEALEFLEAPQWDESAQTLGAPRCRILVLEPFDPRDRIALAAWERLPHDAVTRTIGSAQGLQAVCQLGAERTGSSSGVPIILEAQSSMRRFGFTDAELLQVLAEASTRSALRAGHVVLEGLSLHLPLAQPADDISPRGSGSSPSSAKVHSAKVRQLLQWMGLWQAEISQLQPGDVPGVWVSHCTDEELLEVTSAVPQVPLRLRTGTDLWLGDRRALHARGTVLSVVCLTGGAPAGYRQRSRSRDGQVVTVSGGTWHGVGLQAPSPVSTVRQRAVAAGTGALDAAGRALSPFTWDGRQRWFVEPPHQHVSMLWLPSNCPPPTIGAELDADVRFTTTRFDQVLGLD